MDSFRERLALALKENGMSQAELSRQTGIGRNSISDYLKGKYEAKQDYIFLIANALMVNEAWLMGFDTNMKKDSINDIYNKLSLDRQLKLMNCAMKILNEQVEEDQLCTKNSNNPQQ